MKKGILLFIGVLIQLSSRAQERIHSSCTASDSVIAQYKTDAQRMALIRAYQIQSPDTAKEIIDVATTDSFLHAIATVYNASILPERDSVIVKYKIHSQPDLTDLTIQGDISQGWFQDLVHNTIPTSNGAVNSLFTQYGLKNIVIPSGYFLAVQAKDNYNMRQIGRDWKQNVPGVSTVLDYGTGRGHSNEIFAANITGTYIDLVFSRICEESPSNIVGNCPYCVVYRKNWMFRCFYNCDVQFISAWEGDSSQTSVPAIPVQYETISVYPSPFSNYIRVTVKNNNTANGNLRYTLYDITGRMVVSGYTGQASVSGTTEIKLPELSAGVYVFQVMVDGRTENHRLIKE